jgi:hypothetical protein
MADKARTLFRFTAGGRTTLADQTSSALRAESNNGDSPARD